MAHNQDGNQKQVHYVGDSRVRVNSKEMLPPDYSQFPGKTEQFFPDFLLKEWMVAAVFLVGFMTLVMAENPPLGDIADPTNTGFLPVPDWYFLFLYQLLKYKWAAGPFTVVGIIVVPGLLFGGLMLAPFLDTSKERRPIKRPVTTGIAILSLLGVIGLTWAAEAEHVIQVQSSAGTPAKDHKIVAEHDKGYELYKKNACIKCHGDKLQGVQGPPLLGVGDRIKGEDEKLTRKEIEKVIDEGRGAMPAGMFQGSEADKQVLLDWLMQQKQK
ncbi:menaquinol-cytochrome c reductase cytochrome b/c subunit [Thermoactinomyces sp. DSM 45891]|uniref:menaquinol-cytochrome c reductase cytochrome b/c subunit n=1 Tax=Thermoactinomyces sp. DSM 45891 TaxID=1761907 RepID=UPI0009245F20|nr:menaquinol-cytochrome c reductase cytochrome b/c subunit [Thermoactinomyces sp. DSM 45891]SFX00149.1 menaquinol-cytochrome c reductase cytochrome b/c subunit [Thermoactinomyces sp. DSM 45891]